MMMILMKSNNNYNNNHLTMQTNSQNWLDIIVAALTNGFLKFLARFSGRRRVSQVHRKKEEQNQHLVNQHHTNNHHHHQQQRPKSCSSHHHNSYNNLVIPVIVFLLLSTICDVSDACSSRTTPKPRPPTPTPRPNITFHTYKCPDAYANWYCLNGATCFTVKIGVEVLYNCECADGYIGPRCDYKDLDGSYLSSRPRVMLETASIAGGAVAALFLAFVVGFFVYVRWHQGKKRDLQDEIEERIQNQQQQVHQHQQQQPQQQQQQPQQQQQQSQQQINGNGHHHQHQNGNGSDAVDGIIINSSDPCKCIQSQVHYNTTLNLSSNSNQSSNGENNSSLQHPQQQQFHAVPHLHHHHENLHQEEQLSPSPPPQDDQQQEEEEEQEQPQSPHKRPFGPHHYHAITMSDVLLKR